MIVAMSTCSCFSSILSYDLFQGLRCDLNNSLILRSASPRKNKSRTRNKKGGYVHARLGGLRSTPSHPTASWVTLGISRLDVELISAFAVSFTTAVGLSKIKTLAGLSQSHVVTVRVTTIDYELYENGGVLDVLAFSLLSALPLGRTVETVTFSYTHD